jgi:hypothetical protein
MENKGGRITLNESSANTLLKLNSVTDFFCATGEESRSWERMILASRMRAEK